jgi:protein TonB
MLQARANALGFEDVNATVGLSFTIDASGRVTSSAITRASGDFKVDAALRRMITSASFPPPPGGRFTGAVTVRIH